MAYGRVPESGQIVHTAGPLGVEHGAKILYVNKVATDGWLQARDDRSHALVPLAKYTRVAIVGSANRRTTFRVDDGPAKDRLLSLSDANALDYLGSKEPVRALARAVVTYGKYVEHWISIARGGQALDQQMGTLEIAGLSLQVTMNSVWDGRFSPIPAGEYKVLLPDTPHKGNMTRFYRETEPSLKFDQVWFPIQYGDNSRYVHVGNLSEGCTTVLDLARWADVHEALISHRGPDSRSVATLVVRGTPERAR